MRKILLTLFIFSSFALTAQTYNIPDNKGVLHAFSYINVKDYGAKGDGTTDDVASLQALINSNTTIFLPKGVYYISTAINLAGLSNFKMFGEVGTVIKMTAASGAIYPYTLMTVSGTTNNLQISNIKFLNTATQATEQNAGIININGLSSTLYLDGLNINNCEFTAPSLNANAISLITTDAARATNIKFNDNVIDSVGRMGFEFISRAPGGSTSDNITRYSNIRMYRNTVNYTGLNGTFGCGFSLSGTCENIDISNNLFFEIGKNHAIELVGAHKAVVNANRMVGIAKTFNAFCTNNDAGLNYNSDIVFSNNTAILYDPTKSGGKALGFLIEQTTNSSIIGNTLNSDGNCEINQSSNITITGNVINSKSYTALLLDNGTTGCFVSGNTISTAGRVGTATGTIRCEDVATIGNIFTGNVVLIPPTGTGHLRFNQTASATGNIFMDGTRSLDAPIVYVSTNNKAENSYNRTDEVIFFAATGVTAFNLPDPRDYLDPQNRGIIIKNLNPTIPISITNTSRIGIGERTSIPALASVYFKVYNELWYVVSSYENAPPPVSGGMSQVLVNNTKLSNTGSTTNNTIFTGTIPANSIGVNGSYQIIMQVSAGASNANSKVFYVKFNGTNVIVTPSLTRQSVKYMYVVSNRNSLSSQVVMPDGSGGSGTFNSASGAPFNTFTFDTSADITITVTCQNANSADVSSLEAFSIIAVK